MARRGQPIDLGRTPRMEIEELKAERDEALKQMVRLVARNEELERDVVEMKRMWKESEEKWMRMEKKDSRDVSVNQQVSGNGGIETRRMTENTEVDEINGQILPHELMCIIADNLRDDHLYRSLGMFGLVSRALHEDITRLFHETMVCDRGWRMDWELKNGRLIPIPASQLPLNKWKHARYVVEDIRGSLIKNRKKYFPQFALGLLKYGAEMVGPLGPENYGDLIIAKQVSKAALSKFLQLPLYWDRDAAQLEWDVRPLKQVNKITIEPSGGLLPDESPLPAEIPIVCNPRNHVSRILNIEFERGSAANEAVFSSTVGTIFEMVDPHFDPQRAVEVPFVKIRILDGLDGLLSFVRLLGPILSRHLALDIGLEVVEWTGPQGDSNDPPPPDTLAEDKFRGAMLQIRDVFAKSWPSMRSYRRAGNAPPAPNATIFAVDIMFASTDTEVMSAEFSGYVEDEEEAGEPNTAPSLYVAAEHIDVHTREATPMWEQVLGSEFPFL